MTQLNKAIEAIAAVAQEANRRFCKTHGDESQVPWEDAPEWQKDSVIRGVRFHLEGERTQEDSHTNWMKQKLSEGWIYGPEKNVQLKTHPCLVPYYELPLDQQLKDALFMAVVLALSPIAAIAKGIDDE